MDRRQFVNRLVLGGGAALVAGPSVQSALAEPPPETTTLRIDYVPGPCTAPQYVAAELLQSEGFTDVHYVRYAGAKETAQGMGAGEIDFSVKFVGSWIKPLDGGSPIVILAGIHVGCFELFTVPSVRTLRDLKGKTIGITQTESGRHIFLVSLLQHIGLDHRHDVRFATEGPAKAMRLLSEEKIDAYMAFPPTPKNSGRRESGACYSTRPPTGRGRSISAACWPPTGASSRSILWPPSGPCGRS